MTNCIRCGQAIDTTQATVDLCQGCADRTNWTEKFWDELLARPVLLRFKVTDKPMAGHTISGWLQPKPINSPPGIELEQIVLKDTSERAKEFFRELDLLVGKYREVIQ